MTKRLDQDRPREAPAICDLVGAFVDGEIGAEEGERFRRHLPGCAACQATLDDLLQLEAQAYALRVAGPVPIRPPTVDRAPAPAAIPLAAPRRARWVAAAMVGAGFAAAAGWLVISRSGDSAGSDVTALLALGPTRTIEARLSLPAADHWRSYDVARAAASPHRAVPLGTLARLEQKGDLHAIATAFLLDGEDDQAAAFLDRAGHGPDLDSDRAAMALRRGRQEDALALLEGVLAVRPRHAQALWNRALALGELGLSLSAAAAFDEVASLGEPGWTEEARQRAAALRATTEERGRSWHAAMKDGMESIQAGGYLPPSAVRAHPGLARLFLYDAVRAAGSAERVRSLLPPATELDRRYGGTVLADYVRATAASDFARRRPLAETYAALFADEHKKIDDEAYFAAVRRAGQGDILLGALTLQHRVGAHLAEYRRLAEASGDPWFRAMAAHEQARSEIDRGDLTAAEQTLLGAAAECTRTRIEYRCAAIENELALLYRTMYRLVEARQHALAGWELARQGNEWGTEVLLLQTLAEVARMRYEFPTARALLDEALRRQPESCVVRRYVASALANIRIMELRPTEARVEVGKAPLCDGRMALAGAEVYADLAHVDGSVAEAARVIDELEVQARAVSPARLALVHELEGRLLIDRDRERGRALLERAIGEADALPGWLVDAAVARSRAYSTLVIDAGARGDSAGALALLAREIDAPPPTTCTLGVALDDERTLVVARGARGEVVGRVDRGRTRPGLDASHLVPADVLAALAGCARVEVIARPPVHGAAGLLPPTMAWGYRGHGGAASRDGGVAERRVVVSDVAPPRSLGLPRLRAWASGAQDGGPAARPVEIKGEAATPSRVLDEIEHATDIELHAHGLVDAAVSDVSLVVLSPEANGLYALTAAEVRRRRLRGAPLVILAACSAATTAPYLHEAWSLPAAFVEAGARAVLASPSEIQDSEAGPFFDAVRARMRGGEPAAVALRSERVAWLARNPASWVSQVLLFE